MFVRIFAVVTIAIGFVSCEAFAQEAKANSKRIEWRTSVLDAFVEAVENTKPLVVAFVSNPAFLNDSGYNHGNHTWAELDELVVHELADKAVFAVAVYDHRSERVRDEYANRMLAHLKLTIMPSISVIEPRTDVLTENERMEGTHTAPEIANYLAASFDRIRIKYGINQVPKNEVIPTAPAAAKLELNPYEPSLSSVFSNQ